MDDLYIRIKQRREALGLTQEQLAQKMGYHSRSSINKIELGLNDIPQSKISAFAKALETTPAYLFGWTDENTVINLDDGVLNELYTNEKKLRLAKLICSLTNEELNRMEALLDAALLLRHE